MRPDNLDEPSKVVPDPQHPNVWVVPDVELTEDQKQELIDSARDGDTCRVAVWHGPGHQSHTECMLHGDHDVHHARYGEFNDFADWPGVRDVFADYHDGVDSENPEYVRDDFTLRHRRRMADYRRSRA